MMKNNFKRVPITNKVPNRHKEVFKDYLRHGVGGKSQDDSNSYYKFHFSEKTNDFLLKAFGLNTVYHMLCTRYLLQRQDRTD